MRALKTLTLMLVMALVACGGGTETTDTTVADDVNTTTIVDATTVTTAAEDDDAGTVDDFDDMPAECVDLMVSFFKAIEPALEDFDFATMDFEDMETLGTELESVTSGFEDDIENLNCPDFETTDDEEAFAAMIDIAEREAPGVVAYLEWIQEFASTADTIGSGTSGDCETDIAAMEAFIADNATMVDLTMEERVEVLDLVSSISAGCSIDRQQEFFSQEDVSAFMGG
jgi:hypothetical protein